MILKVEPKLTTFYEGNHYHCTTVTDEHCVFWRESGGSILITDLEYCVLFHIYIDSGDNATIGYDVIK